MDLKKLMTVKQFAEAYPVFSEASLRWMLFKRDTNGLVESGAVFQLGRRVLINAVKFSKWLERQ
jgi:hypothetical protein